MVCEVSLRGHLLDGRPVLILVLMEYGLRDLLDGKPIASIVLILVLMEYGLRVLQR